ncbi:zymogen granule membrane protein 16 [Sander lucioperca]|uniref:Jacalin-type lectin domain-containing protein n=1 Tax=Sander lucioperca TaxID=283035 RepID=A0A8D0D4A0_SANLU|nr:zymogen granule membrane protein 16 [Sander lucioperca]
MFSLLFFAVFCASCLAAPTIHRSFSPDVGPGTGTAFATGGGDQRITAIRIWERSGAYISGIQLRFGFIWAERVGVEVGIVQQLDLFDGESFVQVSGKFHSDYIYQLTFVTSRGRFLMVGQPITNSFNLYPTYSDEELRLLSGRFNGAGITSLAAHWGVFQGNSSYIQ